MTSSANTRIAKNTGMLYFRMLLTMTVSLYTSRIVLNTIGVEDFGIYNVVGGFVTMFSFFNNAMASGTQRFLSFEIGKNNFHRLQGVFNMSVNIHFMIALLILILAETIGLWFVNNHLTIPAERMLAARWVYHFSVLTFFITVISVPFYALIIAHERMNVYAWVSIIEVSLKLIIVFLLQWFGFDKLMLYAVLIFVVSLIIRIIYSVYCNRNFSESHYRFMWNKSLFYKLTSYAAWNLWGNAAVVFSGQGVNILLNIFFGPIINAARGIAYQVRGAIFSFMLNFQIAVKPQIVKTYAVNDFKNMHKLIILTAKFSFFLLFALSAPILLETTFILKLWLKIVPAYTVLFTQLAILNILVDCLISPLTSAAQASGKIRLYQSIMGGVLLLILPASWLLLKLGYPPEVTLYVSISASVLVLFPMLKIVNHLVNLSIKEYFNKVIFVIIPVAVVSVIPPFTIKYLLNESFFRLIITIIISEISILSAIYFLGINSGERAFFQTHYKSLITKLKNKFNLLII